jgi:HlyD family secretion protein
VDAYPGQTFRGKVAQIRQAPINVQNVITYDIVIAVSNPDLKLFPGMTANATIFTGHAANALRIPKAAIAVPPIGVSVPSSSAKQLSAPKQTAASTTDSAEAQVVYVLDQKGQPKAVRVRTGISDANHVEALSGDLQEGQESITGTAVKAGTSGSIAPGQRRHEETGVLICIPERFWPA